VNRLVALVTDQLKVVAPHVFGRLDALVESGGLGALDDESSDRLGLDAKGEQHPSQAEDDEAAVL
jgi:hypothetical protein